MYGIHLWVLCSDGPRNYRHVVGAVAKRDVKECCRIFMAMGLGVAYYFGVIIYFSDYSDE